MYAAAPAAIDLLLTGKTNAIVVSRMFIIIMGYSSKGSMW